MWITGDVDLPLELVEALSADHLVLFVGAGASLNPPSSLPLYSDLARQIADLAAVPFDENMPTDAFLGRLADQGDFDVHRQAKSITGSAASRFNAVHAALVAVADVASPRIITTNYDNHIASAADAAGIDLGHRYFAPALPLGRSFSGLVHLHGSVTMPEAGLVLTDRDFGHAYLTDAWASRFLQGVFAEYTVLFVGYSHSDVVLSYLAMGLPPGARRFALTSSPEDEKWDRLQIQPIGYPSVDDHVAVQLALEAWVTRAKMGLLDHRSRIRDIVAGGPPKTPVDVDYLDSMLITPEGAKLFAEVATDPGWLDWMDSRSSFAALFNSSMPLSPGSEALAHWFSTAYAADASRSDAALAAIQRHGQALHEGFVNRLAWSIKPLWTTNPDTARRWQALIATSLGTKLLGASATETLHSRRTSERATDLILLRRTLVPFIRLRKPLIWDDSERIRPSHEIAWPIDSATLKESLENLHPSAAPSDVMALLEQALLDAYDLTDAYAGPDAWDPFSFSRSAIEPHPQDDNDSVMDLIIDGLRDLADHSGAGKTALIERWLQSPRAVLRRLAVHTLSGSRRTADSKINWVLNADLLYDFSTKHETYALLAAALPEASRGVRQVLLTKVIEGPRDEEDTVHAEYAKFNLLIWLTKALPRWRSAQNQLAKIKSEYTYFEARGHPDLDHEHWFGSWEPSVPTTVDEWVNRIRAEGPSSAITWLYGLDYSRRFMDGPDWEAALKLVRSTAAMEPAVGAEIWDSLIDLSSDPRDSEILGAVVVGWGSSKSQRDWSGILARVGNFVGLDGFERPISELTLAVVQDESSAASMVAHASQIAAELARQRASTFEHSPDPEWMSLGLNSWPGNIARFWIQHVARRWRSAGENWAGLSQQEAREIEFLVAGSSHFSDAARPVVGAELYFLFGADEKFAKRALFPLFSAQDTLSANQTWGGYLYHPRVSNRMLEAGFLDIARSAVPIVDSLENGRLASQFFSMLASIVSYLDVSDDAREAMLDELVVRGSEYFVKFLDALEQLLNRVEEPEQAGQLWEDWIGALCMRRLDGIPREPSDKELESWMDIALLAGTSFPTAVQVMTRRPGGLGDGLRLRRIDSQIATKYPGKLIDYLLMRVEHTGSLDSMATYTLRESVRVIAARINSPTIDPLFTLLRSRGIDVDEWLS